MSVNTPNKQTSHLKREILVRLIKAYLGDNYAEDVRLIPYRMRPQGSDIQFRCCIHKERAILRDRVIAGLGFDIEEAQDWELLSDLAVKALDRKTPEEHPLTLLQTACNECVPARIHVTDLCQGCVARPCESACRFGAIKVVNGKSHIDQTKCKSCGLCAQVCPFQAITRIIVPCEHACPVGAIAKDEDGLTRIDHEKCISCGKCVKACPFGAVHKKSQLIDILKNIKAKKQVIAMVAPAIMGQLPCTPQQLREAIIDLGFADVVEVAVGADVTSETESKEFKERVIENGDPFMTTSCCAAYNELVEKHIPELKRYRSTAKTPAYYTAEIVKKENPNAVTVFFSPCVAKRREALQNPNIDYVLSFEELGAWFIATGTQVAECKGEEYTKKASAEGRNYAVTGGVAGAVNALLDDKDKAKPYYVDGLDKASIRDLKKFAKNGKCDLGNLIEVMACPGGCLGGQNTINAYRPAAKQLAEYVKNSPDIKEIIK
ncbi:MAG: monomeric [FeFe] hydrogenase [Cyanobacteriota bacterium]|nr:monomeric [FeFe] hydrogenase [Cyanobacteriota bacterium]MDY6358100.1 monomeric [FeFe] hydrogenase [Cyanobacteriota bacterium]MDY6364043.1 monomeric [FeFe] hydrogenase [Cyanobacteriota bacterium]MDY6383202.1 monomeric [FeFe] hydrogenase [Cyanobacteriota bacterium]